MRRALATLLASAATSLPVIAHAQPEGAAIEVALEPPSPLTVGDRAEVIARVRTSERAGAPLLVTPSSEGSAIEVVRGRLMRADAEDPRAGELRFRVPIVARAAGTAVVRVRVDGFACEAGRCEPLSLESSVALEVRPTR